jgi:hypothetical protein
MWGAVVNEGGSVWAAEEVTRGLLGHGVGGADSLNRYWNDDLWHLELEKYSPCAWSSRTGVRRWIKWARTLVLLNCRRNYDCTSPRRAYPPRNEPSLDARHALAEALRSLADTADALRRLAEVLESASQDHNPPREYQENGNRTAGAGWPLT